MTHVFDRPRSGFVLALIVASGSAFAYVNGALARLEKDSQSREINATRLIESRNRESDDLKARLASLELAARNCVH
jgi:hypothetical protein